jgi:hypothetical protein
VWGCVLCRKRKKGDKRGLGGMRDFLSYFMTFPFFPIVLIPREDMYTQTITGSRGGKLSSMRAFMAAMPDIHP